MQLEVVKVHTQALMKKMRLQMTHIWGSCLILNVSDSWGVIVVNLGIFSTWTYVCPLERELAFLSKINERLSRVA